MGYKSQSPNISSACTYSDVAWDLRIVMVPRWSRMQRSPLNLLRASKKLIFHVSIIFVQHRATVRTDTAN